MIAEKRIVYRTRKPHKHQAAFLQSQARRIVIRAGRRGGKTVGVALYAVKAMLRGQRVLYATPTQDQIQAFWYECKRTLADALDEGIFAKNETDHSITLVGTKQRIRAKTAWNADTLRGDYADVLILDEYQLMSPDAWEEVGAPMLMDRDGVAVFIYTPPDPLRKAEGYKSAQALFQRGLNDTTGEWASFHFTSRDNPYLSVDGIERMGRDMTAQAYQREIMAEDTDEIPDALWSRALIEQTRVVRLPATIDRIAIGVDPPGGATECGIVAAAYANGETFIFADESIKASPEIWARRVLVLAEKADADIIAGEKNYGGDMVEAVIRQAMPNGFKTRLQAVTATRGKAIRAEPLLARFERGEAHIVGSLPKLEDEMCTWVPGSRMDSPNRLDAMVWADAALSQRKAISVGIL